MTDQNANTSLLIRNARCLDPATGLDQITDVLIEDGLIAGIGATVGSTPERTLDADGLCLAPGLIDLRVKTGEPGEEFRETLETAGDAAVAGGVTSMAIMPDTVPVIDDVALVEFIARRGKATAKPRIYPIGALTRGLEGQSMAELGLMQVAGVHLFSNGERSVANASIMKRLMKYASGLNACIYSRAEDSDLVGSGIMNAGTLADRMGLAGMSPDAEWIIAARDLVLAEQTGVKYLLDQASTRRTIDLVSEARAKGVDAHCTVAAYNLFFNELDIGDYLTYCKTSPPFRTEADRLGLVEAVKARQVQAVVSAHNPQPPERKRVPYPDAAFGAAGLETTLSAMMSLVMDGHMSLLEALYPLTAGPADLLNVPQGRLSEGAPADLVVFDPNKPWLCDRENLISKSTNSPFDGRRLYGKVRRTYVAGQLVFEASNAH